MDGWRIMIFRVEWIIGWMNDCSFPCEERTIRIWDKSYEFAIELVVE